MQFIPIVLRSVLIITLFSGIISGATSSEKPDLVEQTIEAIKDCIVSSPAPWPDEWKQEYIDTIRKAIESLQDAPQYNVKLKILSKGFAPYWESLVKTKERPLFEIHLAQIRWYTEHLMGMKFPTDQERQKLRDQYTDIWNYAADSLLKQFPFLDPNAMQRAKQDDLGVCYRKIDAPLMPAYLRPMSEKQVTQVKQRWDKLRYDRVDLWRRLGGGSTMISKNNDPRSSGKERDYELTKESLSQLLWLVWMVVPQRPDYYRSAMEKRSNAVKQHLESMRRARSNERRLEKTRSRQLLQTEHISFLLSVMLETPRCLDGSLSIRAHEQTPSVRQDKTAKGGDAYDLKNVSPEK